MKPSAGSNFPHTGNMILIKDRHKNLHSDFIRVEMGNMILIKDRHELMPASLQISFAKMGNMILIKDRHTMTISCLNKFFMWEI